MVDYLHDPASLAIFLTKLQKEAFELGLKKVRFASLSAGKHREYLFSQLSHSQLNSNAFYEVYGDFSSKKRVK